MTHPLFTTLQGGLIVSCQALEEEPLHSSFIMGRMALAAWQGGAVGIRANSVVDILEIKKTVPLPIIGLIKQVYADSPVYITPTLTEVEALVSCGCEMIAIDATDRLRTGGHSLDEVFTQVRRHYPDQLFMADCATIAEAKHAVALGFDCVGTTMAGYTEETSGTPLPAVDMIATLAKQLTVPVIAEGGIHDPQQLQQVIQAGATCAVVGGAITRPREITKRFVTALEDLR